jgi:hypothetical protein
VKPPGVVVALSGFFCLAVHVNAREVITCKSPDGKFALRHVYHEQQPLMAAVAKSLSIIAWGSYAL